MRDSSSSSSSSSLLGLSSDVWLDGVDEVGCLQQVLLGDQSFSAKRGSLGQMLCPCFLV